MGPGQDLRRKALRLLAGEIWVGNDCGRWYIEREAGPHAHDDVGANMMGLLAGIVAAFAVDAGHREGSMSCWNCTLPRLKSHPTSPLVPGTRESTLPAGQDCHWR